MGKRLIDANALLASDIYYDHTKCLIPRYEVENAPTVDAVEVVRCKECQLWQPHCNGKAGMCKKMTGIAMPNDFCSYGERRSDE